MQGQRTRRRLLAAAIEAELDRLEGIEQDLLRQRVTRPQGRPPEQECRQEMAQAEVLAGVQMGVHGMWGRRFRLPSSRRPPWPLSAFPEANVRPAVTPAPLPPFPPPRLPRGGPIHYNRGTVRLSHRTAATPLRHALGPITIRAMRAIPRSTRSETPPPAAVMRFDTVDLKLFTHIAEANSLTRGAERSHLSLAAASTRIKNLEEHVGVKLLSRSNRA